MHDSEAPATPTAQSFAPAACPQCNNMASFSKRRALHYCDECELQFDATTATLSAPQSTPRGQVFLSYGHDPACTSLVRRVKADLETLGWKTWIDESGGITFGDDWRREITKGIHESQHVPPGGCDCTGPEERPGLHGVG
jgi:TIR domain